VSGSAAAALDQAVARAVALQQRGAWNEAEHLLQALQRQHPRSVGPRRELALLHSRRQQPEAAIAQMRRAIELAPGDPQLHCELGRMLAAGGQADAALAAFREATLGDPGWAEAWYFLGITLRRTQRGFDALQALRRAHQLNPAAEPLLRALAECEFESGDPADALPLWRRLCERAPEQAEAWLKQAECLTRLGDHAAALALYRDAVARLPQSPDLWLGMAQAQEDVGEREQAEASYLRALELRPDWAFALGGLLELKRARAPLKLIERAGELRLTAPIGDPERALLGYGLGKALDGLGRYDEAMASWIDANAARRRVIGPLDRPALERWLQATLEGFGPALWKRLADTGNPDPRPVFVLGMPRSGTTLVEQIIAAHPQAAGCGELPDIALFAQRLPEMLAGPESWPQHPHPHERRALTDFAARFLAQLERLGGPDATRAVDKSPLNFFHVGLIRVLFPNARVVWCRRDPRDIGLSIFSENFGLQSHFATDLADIGYFHRLHEQVMAHWQALAPLPIIEIRYEALVADVETQTRRLIAFLDLPWDAACLQFHSSDRAVQTPSRWQVRQPIYSGSMGRWRNYARWLEPLLQELGPLPD
jgi:tetratricopeptide (TPR) repeat protein